MKAIGYVSACPISDANAFSEFEFPVPEPGPRDLLVEVRGVSVNPVDTKIRGRIEPEDGPRILGFDGSGVVRAVGNQVKRFSPGDEVYYAGDITRPGTNAQFQVVDERIVGRKPSSLGFAEAAGIPLTSITAWELLFDKLGLCEGQGQGDALLVVGGAGGVGSILIQLAKQLTGLSVIATASRPDTKAWVKEMGADYVIDHRRPLNEEMKALGIAPRYVAGLTKTEQHFPSLVELVKPFGHIALIDDPKTLDVVPLKTKALSLSWEFMFSRSMFQTPDMDAQQKLLDRVADLLDEGTLVSTVNRNGGPLTAKSLASAHELQESGKAIGKTVLGALAEDPGKPPRE